MVYGVWCMVMVYGAYDIRTCTLLLSCTLRYRTYAMMVGHTRMYVLLRISKVYTSILTGTYVKSGVLRSCFLTWLLVREYCMYVLGVVSTGTIFWKFHRGAE